MAEYAIIQPSRSAPYAEPVSAHRRLDAGQASIGEEVAVICLNGAEDLNDPCAQSIGAGTHVDGHDGDPHGVDAYDPSESFNQRP